MPDQPATAAHNTSKKAPAQGGFVSNATLEKFNYPETVVEETESWAVLLRPAQATLGSLVLVCKEPVQTFSAISKSAFDDLHEITGRIEGALKKAFDYDKINYLMLMMVDPDVHFHIIPRYADERRFATTVFRDTGWPGPPDLKHDNEMNDTDRDALRKHLISIWD
jgi:diadenosine tetraphosphate (Ap4A) HIT family hydrolase